MMIDTKIHGALGCILAVLGFQSLGWFQFATITAFVGAAYCWQSKD